MNINFTIRSAGVKDIPVILNLIKELSIYEKLSHEVTATEEKLTKFGFGEKKDGIGEAFRYNFSFIIKILIQHIVDHRFLFLVENFGPRPVHPVIGLSAQGPHLYEINQHRFRNSFRQIFRQSPFVIIETAAGNKQNTEKVKD